VLEIHTHKEKALKAYHLLAKNNKIAREWLDVLKGEFDRIQVQEMSIYIFNSNLPLSKYLICPETSGYTSGNLALRVTCKL
jgi:hypothetical protein